MKFLRHLTLAAAVGLSVAALAGSAQAAGYGVPGCSTCGGSSHGFGFGGGLGLGGGSARQPATLFQGQHGGLFKSHQNLPVFQAAPWYNYWPYDGHFLTPAPVSGPFYGPPLTGNFPVNPYFPGPAMPYGAASGFGQGIPGGPPPNYAQPMPPGR